MRLLQRSCTFVERRAQQHQRAQGVPEAAALSFPTGTTWTTSLRLWRTSWTTNARHYAQRGAPSKISLEREGDGEHDFGETTARVKAREAREGGEGRRGAEGAPSAIARSFAANTRSLSLSRLRS